MGRKRGSLNLGKAEIDEIARRAAAGEPYGEIARDMGVDRTTVNRHGRRLTGARTTHGEQIALTEPEASTT